MIAELIMAGAFGSASKPSLQDLTLSNTVVNRSAKKGDLFAAITGTSPSLPTPTYDFALPSLHTAAIRVQAGTGRGVLLAVGDSTTRGWGSGLDAGHGDGTGGAYNAGISLRGWPAQFSAALTSAGLPSRCDAIVGGLQPSMTFDDWLSTYAPMVAGGDGWGRGLNSLGGYGIVCPDANNNALSYTPQATANRFDVLVWAYPGKGALTISDTSGMLGEIDTAIPGPLGDGMAKLVTISRPISSTSPISIQRKSGSTGDIYVVGVIPYDTTSPRMEVINLGFPGSTAADQIVAGGFAGFDSLPIFANYVDGSTLCLGINDSNQNTDATTFQSNLQKLSSRLKTLGDVQLIKPHKALNGGVSTNPGTTNVPDSYLAAIDAVQATIGAYPAINFNVLDSSIAADYADAIHRSKQGYAKEVPAIMNGMAAN